MKRLKHITLAIMLVFLYSCTSSLTTYLQVANAQPPGYDSLYGKAELPNYLKHFEVNKENVFWINPYLQVANAQTPGYVSSEHVYNWIIDTQGNVRINIESPNPYGRTYPNGCIRPEDKKSRKPGWTEEDGHVSTLGGERGRIGGEILYDAGTNTWIINNKSGRFSFNYDDRSIEQLRNAAILIQSVVIPRQGNWGQVEYLLLYAPDAKVPTLLNSPNIQYKEPKKSDVMKKGPYLIVPLN